MKRKTIFGIGIAAAITLTACNTNPEKKDNQEKTQQETHEHKIHEHEKTTESEDQQIMLNEGERWEVNSEMIPHVKAAEETLNTYVEDGNSDYKSLAENLKINNSALISSCTMQGESHEQLHHWLHPHLEMVKALEAAEDQEEANKVIADLQASFEKYHNYFK